MYRVTVCLCIQLQMHRNQNNCSVVSFYPLLIPWYTTEFVYVLKREACHCYTQTGCKGSWSEHVQRQGITACCNYLSTLCGEEGVTGCWELPYIKEMHSITFFLICLTIGTQTVGGGWTWCQLNKGPFSWDDLITSRKGQDQGAFQQSFNSQRSFQTVIETVR